MKFVPKAVSRSVGRTILKTQKSSPTLLFAVGVVGFAGTVVLAARATLRVDDEVLTPTQKQLQDAKAVKEFQEGKSQFGNVEQAHQETVVRIYMTASVRALKLYGPTIAVGAVTMVAFGSSHHILKERNAALSAAYLTLWTGFAEYRARVAESVGTEKEREIFLDGKTWTGTDLDGKKVVHKVTQRVDRTLYARFLDNTNPYWENNREITMVTLKGKQEYLNDKLDAKGHVFLNEVYDALGLERTKDGQVMGWVRNKGNEPHVKVDFGVFNNEELVYDFVFGNEGALLLSFNVQGPILELI